MNNAILWDKVTPINGVPAEKLIQENPYMETDDIVLVGNIDTGKVIRIESVQILSANEGIDVRGKSPLQIFEEFEDIQLERELKNQEEIDDIKQLKQQLQVTQEALDFLLLEGM